MNKEILIELYRSKDRKRKLVLYELYSKQIQLNLSRIYITSMINRDLGVENLIKPADITYCRFYFKDQKFSPILEVKKEKDVIKPAEKLPRKVEYVEKHEELDIDWPVQEEYIIELPKHKFKFKEK
jgi:hypothetical protein